MARQKISKPEGDKDELPDLTDQQMKFCEGILAGMSQSAAYREAYNCENMGTPTIQVAASRLRHDAKIALWLDAARYDRLEDHKCTFDGHLEELNRLKGIAVRTGNVGAAVQAEQLRGKASGHYVEKFEQINSDDPLRTLAEIAKHDPGYAARLAREHDLPWQPESDTRH